MKTCQSDVIAL